MREFRLSGSVRGASSNGRPYRERVAHGLKGLRLGLRASVRARRKVPRMLQMDWTGPLLPSVNL